MANKVYFKSVNVVKKRLGIQKNGPAQRFFSNTCFRYMSTFVPGGTKSHLNQTAIITADYIEYQGPSAHYLYTGKKYIDPKYKVAAFPIRGGKISFNKADGVVEGFVSRKDIPKIPTNIKLEYHTPGTGAHWDKLMLTSKGKEVAKEVQAYVDRGCK